ncbi:MAG: NADPH:quinone oxidoreductase family protein [Deltaproteobacteria bacterium]|nr:NADPH:quinone oxidoreductase family protein [Deltaproteobacteria bacterium]
MSATEMKPGKKVVVAEFAENPVEAIEKYMSIQDMAPPDPVTLKGHEVIISIKSVSVGWVDLLMTSGQYQHMPHPPYTPGMEYSGLVLETGSAVPAEKIAVGDRVLVDGLQAGPRSGGTYQDQGGFASYAVVPDRALYRIPEGFSFDQACCLLSSYETAYHCLITRGRLKEGETVLINGASGSTGLAAVHIAKIVGATVIATGRSGEKLAVVKAQGADQVINCKNAEGESGVRRFRDEVKGLTGGRGVDVVYDGVGGEVSMESLRCVSFGARFLIVGWASTPFVAKGRGQRGAPNANQLPTNLIMMKGLDVLGCPMVISTINNPAIRPPRFNQIMRWVAEGRIKPHISHVFPLPEYKKAMKAKWSGQVIGSCVLHP